jgi:RNA polymerase sigma factor (sigma-70 family)
MENLNLIRKIAWSFHHTTGLEFDDLLQEATWAYLHALKTYDPKRGRITTYVWVHITSHLKNYLKQENKHNDPIDFIEDIEIEMLDHSYVTPTPFWESLSQDAQEVAEMVITSPKPFITHGKPKARKRVKQVMINRGWDLNRMCIAIKELQLLYS